MIKAPPTGLLMISNLDPQSRVLDPTDDQVLAKFQQLEFDDLQEALAKVRAVEAEWDLIVPLLPAPYQTVPDVADLVGQRGSLKPDLPTRLRRARRKAIKSSVAKSLLRLRHSLLHRGNGRGRSA